MRKGWWALLVLAAVFAMHGLQCASDTSHHLTGQGVGSTVMSMSLPGPFAAVDQAFVPELTPPEAPGHAAHMAPRPAPDGASSDLPADFWAVCLAVLSAGLALLAAVLLRARALAWARAPAARRQAWVSAPALRRPPDLFALCVLRN